MRGVLLQYISALVTGREFRKGEKNAKKVIISRNGVIVGGCTAFCGGCIKSTR